jgi:hypothetical protein
MLSHRLLAVVFGAGLLAGCSFPTEEFRAREAFEDSGVTDRGGDLGLDVPADQGAPLDVPVDRPPTADAGPDVVAADAARDAVVVDTPPMVDVPPMGCSADVACAAGSACCGGTCVAVQSDDRNCGACGNACGAGRSCCNGACTDVTSDTFNCGACGGVCDFVNGTARCTAGACAGGTCTAGYGDCDSDATNGCETNLGESPQHCSMCGRSCVVGANATARCESMACRTTCDPGYGDCDGNAGNGCESQLSTSSAHCGSCGRACANAANATGVCLAGACGLTCAAGFADCDGNAANGCEVNTQTSISHCGACGAVCARNNAVVACMAGVCGITGCATGSGNCDSNPANGCETNTRLDSVNCGTCGRACVGTQVCANGACQATCATGSTLCSGACVDTATNPANCGSCGRACALTNATAGCAAGACTLASCNAGFGNCDGSAANGCEVNTNTDARNCGGCGEVCNSTNGTASCLAGQCRIACAAGFADCNADPDDGCETNLRTSVANCGACGQACSVANGTATCLSGACAVGACAREYANCDGSAANGCEVNTSRDVSNCGACGAACLRGQFCSGSVCQLSCGIGLTACSGACVNLLTDEANCGSCGRRCAVGLTCLSGACGYPAPSNDVCASAADVNLAAGSRITLSGTLRGASRQVSPPCGTLGTAEVFYRLTLTRREFVYADTFGSVADTKLFFMSSCSSPTPAQTAGDAVCDDDRGLTCTGGTTGAQVFTVLPAGTYYLAVSLQSGTANTFALHIEHLPVGGGRVAPLARGSNSLTGTTSGTSAYSGSGCGGSGPEAAFWWVSCPETVAGSFSASTCVGTGFDPVLNLLNGSGAGQVCSTTPIATFCSTNSASISQTVAAGAGLHALIVDGYGGTSGAYNVSSTRP